jgi:hypothetical protein
MNLGAFALELYEAAVDYLLVPKVSARMAVNIARARLGALDPDNLEPGLRRHLLRIV